jgi:hypothetical protein
MMNVKGHVIVIDKRNFKEEGKRKFKLVSG